MDSTVPAASQDVPQDLVLLMQMVQEEMQPVQLQPVVLPVRLPIQLVGVPAIKEEPVEEGALSDHEVADVIEHDFNAISVKIEEDVKPVAVKIEAPSPEGASESGSEEKSDSEEEESDENEESSSSESEEDVKMKLPRKEAPPLDAEDMDEEGGPTGPAAFATKNEILVPDVALPEIEEIDPQEKIENIGEVMNVVDSVVVVKGRVNSQYQVIDTESLLVFEDRKVLGYVFETFGAVTNPLYSIRFPSSSSIDRERVTVGRPVFHVPERSNYVFTRHLLMLKGSDASNVHDEEVSDSELEFSDDEKEAEYKRSKKQKRANRRDIYTERPPEYPREDEDVRRLDYGESTSVDPDPRAARGPPIRYDDEDFGIADNESVRSGPSSPSARRSPEAGRDRSRPPQRGRGDARRGNWRPPAGDRGHSGRGRGRGRGRGGPRYSDDRPRDRHPGPAHTPAPYPPPPPTNDNGPGPSHRGMSPASEAIARVTGQWNNQAGPPALYPPYQNQPQNVPSTSQDTYDPRAPTMAQPMHPVSPTMQFPMGGYINPRFAFGGQGGFPQQGYFPQMNPAMGMYGMPQQMAMQMGGGYGAWAGQQQAPQPQGRYPPQDGRRYDDRGGQPRY